MDVGLSKTRIAHLIGRNPSVVCVRSFAIQVLTNQAEEAGKAARAARRRPKRLLDCDEGSSRPCVADLSQAHSARSAGA